MALSLSPSRDNSPALGSLSSLLLIILLYLISPTTLSPAISSPITTSIFSTTSPYPISLPRAGSLYINSSLSPVLPLRALPLLLLTTIVINLLPNLSY
jgi:hypothetical protein